MVTKEYWWGPDDKPFKHVRWARPLSGQRSDLFGWLRTQEAALDEALAQELCRSEPRSPAETSESSTKPEAAFLTYRSNMEPLFGYGLSCNGVDYTLDRYLPTTCFKSALFSWQMYSYGSIPG